jgi:plastocyanin
LNDETWWVPPGSGSVIEAVFPDEGIYVGVDHAMNDVLKGGAFAVLATPDSTASDHPAGTMVPPKGSDMVSGPPMAANATAGNATAGPAANATEVGTEVGAQNQTLSVVNATGTNETRSAETTNVTNTETAGTNATTGGAAMSNATTGGTEANLTQLSGETTNATTGAESLATTGGGANATQTGGATATGASGGGGSATSVSIVTGSSSLTDTAFQPNPVQVSVGDTVTWTNDDTQPHTVVSGANGQPSGEFDSSPNFNPLIAPQQTFEHTFTQAGEYPYYCALHPNMVGTVSVS